MPEPRRRRRRAARGAAGGKGSSRTSLRDPRPPGVIVPSLSGFEFCRLQKTARPRRPSAWVRVSYLDQPTSGCALAIPRKRSPRVHEGVIGRSQPAPMRGTTSAGRKASQRQRSDRQLSLICANGDMVRALTHRGGLVANAVQDSRPVWWKWSPKSTGRTAGRGTFDGCRRWRKGGSDVRGGEPEV